MLRDKDIREPLFDFLELEYGKVRVIEEKNMGRSRADVVMVTDNALYGIEIKSDADTYARLSRQVSDYDKYYDYNYVVVGSTHALHICEHVPKYWGIISVELINDKFDFYVLRRPSENPKMRWKYKLEILWRPELAVIQECFEMPKYKEKSKQFVVDKIIERLENDKIDERLLCSKVCLCLFERDYNTVAEDIAEYRKGELTKKIEQETDILKQIELIQKRENAKRNLKRKKRRRRY